MFVRVKKHPTLGVLVASNGMVYNRTKSPYNYKWTFGGVNGEYAVVKISGKKYRVHRLVAETFLPNPEGKTQVDHILRDTLDNNVCQIRWSTPSENCRNKGNNIGIAELWTTDKVMYRKVWRSMNAEKLRERHWKNRDENRERSKQWYLKNRDEECKKAKQLYWEKREAGFHYVTGADGKKHWEKI